MAFGINTNTNISSLNADRQIGKSSKALNKNFEKLSSGKDINKASDNAAGLAVALELLAQADTSAVASRNISDGVSLINIADAATEVAGASVARLEELAAQAASGQFTDAQRAQLQAEFSAIRDELDRQAQTTEFNGQQLLQNSSVDIQAGTDSSADSRINIKLNELSSDGLGIPTDISSQESARNSLESLKSARNTISSQRGDLGAARARLDTAFNNLKTSELNAREAASRIQDADIAKETADKTANEIRLQSGIAVKAQANQAPALALKLLS